MAQAKRREASPDRRRWSTVLGAWHCETARILLDSPGVQAALLFAEESRESKTQKVKGVKKQANGANKSATAVLMICGTKARRPDSPIAIRRAALGGGWGWGGLREARRGAYRGAYRGAWRHMEALLTLKRWLKLWNDRDAGSDGACISRPVSCIANRESLQRSQRGDAAAQKRRLWWQRTAVLGKF